MTDTEVSKRNIDALSPDMDALETTREIMVKTVDNPKKNQCACHGGDRRRCELDGGEINAAEQAVASAAASERLCPCGSPTPSPAAPSRSHP